VPDGFDSPHPLCVFAADRTVTISECHSDDGGSTPPSRTPLSLYCRHRLIGQDPGFSIRERGCARPLGMPRGLRALGARASTRPFATNPLVGTVIIRRNP